MDKEKRSVLKQQKQLAQIEATKQLLHDFEPVITIVAGAAALGFLENQEFGEQKYHLISRQQKWALLSGIVAIEIARSGLVGQVGDAAGSVGSVAGDAIGKMVPLLSAGAL